MNYFIETTLYNLISRDFNDKNSDLTIAMKEHMGLDVDNLSDKSIYKDWILKSKRKDDNKNNVRIFESILFEAKVTLEQNDNKITEIIININPSWFLKTKPDPIKLKL